MQPCCSFSADASTLSWPALTYPLCCTHHLALLSALNCTLYPCFSLAYSLAVSASSLQLLCTHHAAAENGCKCLQHCMQHNQVSHPPLTCTDTACIFVQLPALRAAGGCISRATCSNWYHAHAVVMLYPNVQACTRLMHGKCMSAASN